MNKVCGITEPFPPPKLQYGVPLVRFFQAGLHIYRYSSIEEFGQVMPHLHDVFSKKCGNTIYTCCGLELMTAFPIQENGAALKGFIRERTTIMV